MASSMAATQYNLTEPSRHLESPRPRGRENANNVLCRNVTLYGHCRHEKTCDFVHDPSKLLNERFNVNSPSFVPLKASTNTRSQLSPKSAVNAPVFTPKSTGQTPSNTYSSPSQPISQPEWNGPMFQTFVPSAYVSHPEALGHMMATYDPFTAVPPMNDNSGHMSYPSESSGTTFYHGPAASFSQPIRYHNYAPSAPVPAGTPAYMRPAKDFFVPEDVREELERKSHAKINYLPSAAVPLKVDQFHSLMPIEVAKAGPSSFFGHTTQLYKAISLHDGQYYCLRRFEGFRLNKEQAIHCVQAWKRVRQSGIVSVHDAFTTRAFGDQSLVIVSDYHPLAKTLVEQHAVPKTRFNGIRNPTQPSIQESVLWGYIVQLGFAIKAIHNTGLAAQSICLSKVILTTKNRVRLSACGVSDVLKYDSRRPLHELQSGDFHDLGRLILGLATNNFAHSTDPWKDIDSIPRSYSEHFRDCVQWLLGPSEGRKVKTTSFPVTRDINGFLAAIMDQIANVHDSVCQAEETKTEALTTELENGRLVRLLAKLQTVIDRPEYAHDPRWSDGGDRFGLRLFRDYVFHQVDASGRPVANLGHILSCLNKLDAGIDEKVALTSRDEQTVLMVSYFDLKQALVGAFNELVNR